MPEVLIKEEKFSGKFVAIRDMKNPEVISSGKDPKEVYEKAVKKRMP